MDVKSLVFIRMMKLDHQTLQKLGYNQIRNLSWHLIWSVQKFSPIDPFSAESFTGRLLFSPNRTLAGKPHAPVQGSFSDTVRL